MGALPVGNRNTLAELSVPAPCGPPARLGLLPGSLRQRLLFPVAQHRAWHVAGAQLSSVVPKAREPLRPSTQAPLLLADGSGRGRTQRKTGIQLTFTEMWGVEGREGPVCRLGAQDTSKLVPPWDPPAITVDSVGSWCPAGRGWRWVRSRSQRCLNSTRRRQGTSREPRGLGPPATDHPQKTRGQRCPAMPVG